jgi:hypothetical protein
MAKVGAYLHARPDGSLFYVGKGSIKRAYKLSPSLRSIHHKRIVSKYGKENILIGFVECSSDDIAFDLERGIIKCLNRSGIELANKTEGGIGGLQDQIPWNKGKTLTNEHKQKLSKARLGVSPWNKGKPFSEEVKMKMSIAAKNRAERKRNAKGQYA